jgi:hypothetical protein
MPDGLPPRRWEQVPDYSPDTRDLLGWINQVRRKDRGEAALRRQVMTAAWSLRMLSPSYEAHIR